MAGEEKWNILIMKHNVDATTALHQEMDSEMANNRLKKMMGVLKAMLSSTRKGTHQKTKHTLARVAPRKRSPAVPVLTTQAAVTSIPGRGHPDPGHGIDGTVNTS